MNFISTDTSPLSFSSTTTTTRLRTFQSSSSSNNQNFNYDTGNSININQQQQQNDNSINDNINYNNNKEKFNNATSIGKNLFIAQTAFIAAVTAPSSSSKLKNNSSSTLPIIGHTMMTIMSPNSGNGSSSGPGRANRNGDRKSEIEPLLSNNSSSNSNTTSATISPMHETYNAANNSNTIIVIDNNHQQDDQNDHLMTNISLDNIDGDNVNDKHRSSSGVVRMDATPNHSHHRHTQQQNGGLNSGLLQNRGDDDDDNDNNHNYSPSNISMTDECFESSSLLMYTDTNYVIRTQYTQLSLRNAILLNMLSLLFVSLNMILNLLVISVIHERVPMDQPHLPDIAFDVLPDHRHFLDIAEYVICIQTFCITVLLFFHKHRSVIFRRICIIMGIIYFFRAICLASTQLPLASKNYYCSPQMKNSTHYANITSLQFIQIVISRVFYMSLGMGLSINGHHTFCGDYIFSGHTVILVLTYLIQQEYLLPARRRTLSWKCVDLIQITMTITSVICILIARGHYFIDIIIAYFVTTRIFWIYHTLCNFSSLANIRSMSNHLNRVWWWPLFVYLENIKVIRHSPNNYHTPSSPSHHQSSMMNHSHHPMISNSYSSANHYTKNIHHSRHHYQDGNIQVQRIFEWPLPWPKSFVRRWKHRSHHEFTA